PAVLQRVESLNDALDPGKAREAIALLGTIGGVLVKGSEDHIWAQFLRAEAHAVLDQEQHVCTVLATIQARSDDATRNGRIDRLRQACP
ncbi:MAG: hypothetical protein H0X64_05315, partial [Gemmatimonadaceae bacterium]|nr:hypothetical protein [Gemmatimonadaceae bacterium]